MATTLTSPRSSTAPIRLELRTPEMVTSIVEVVLDWGFESLVPRLREINVVVETGETCSAPPSSSRVLARGRHAPAGTYKSMCRYPTERKARQNQRGWVRSTRGRDVNIYRAAQAPALWVRLCGPVHTMLRTHDYRPLAR